MAVSVEEREGTIGHWKIKADDIHRQIDDIEERHALVVKGLCVIHSMLPHTYALTTV